MGSKNVNHKLQMVSVNDIQPHPENPRRGDVKAIEESIEANGFYGACIVQRSTGFILVGSHRYEAAKRRGATEIPVIWEDVDDATALRILLVDNRAADLAEYDDALLRLALETVQKTSGNLAGTAWTDKEFEDLTDKLDVVSAQQDPAPKPDSAPKTPAFCRIVIGPYRIDVEESRYDDWSAQLASAYDGKEEILNALKERLQF